MNGTANSAARSRCFNWTGWILFASVSREIEHIEQITDGSLICRNIRIRRSQRVRQIVPAGSRDSGQAPVVLDKLQQRHMVVICMDYCATFRVGRDNYQRDARAVAEEVEDLHIA